MRERYNILFISDSEDGVLPIIEELKEYNFRVQLKFIENCIDISFLLSKENWDIILSDYKAYTLYGKELLRKINGKILIIPYIIIGKEMSEEAIISLIDSGINDYIIENNLNRLIYTIKREIKNKTQLNSIKQFCLSHCLSEEMLQKLLNESNLITWTLDLNVKFLDVNSVFTESLGYSKEETISSSSIFELIHPSDKMDFAQEIRKVLDGKFITNIDYRLKKKDGTYIQLLSNLAPLLNTQNKIIGILCASQDLTIYKKNQEFIEDRIHRQEIVAKFGLEAISETNLDILFEKAVSLLAKTLDVGFTKILELLPNKKFLKLRAGIGWNNGLIGKAIVENNEKSQAGYTLLKTTPVTVDNLKKETRFYAPKLLEDHDIISGMSVIIQGSETPFGILGAHTKNYRIFSNDDINFLQSIANILANVILRNSTEQELRKSEEKYRMLTEQSLVGTLIIANEQIIFVNKGMSDILGFSINMQSSLFSSTK